MSLEGRSLGEFEILERLGEGGMGTVYRARQTSLERIVALKALEGSLAMDKAYIARFRQEAVAAASLRHENLVQVYAAGENEGVHWFAMEYVEGESAYARLKRKGRLPLREAIAIAMHVAAALEHGWRKAALIHRDIKPDNIFLSADGEVKLGDLGLAKSVGLAQRSTAGLTTHGTMMGTPHYISPEQAEGRSDVDLRADIYSLGCTLYHLLTGQTPYGGESAMAVTVKQMTAPVPDITRVWPECPAGLAATVGRMMQKRPAERPQTYEEVSAALREAHRQCSDRSATAAGGRTPEAPGGKTKGRRGRRMAVWLGGAGSLCAIIAGLLVFLPGSRAKQVAPEPERTPATEKSLAPVSPSPGNAAPDEGHPRTATPGEKKTNPAVKTPSSPTPAMATREEPFVNSLGMKFVPVPIPGEAASGSRVLFCISETRLREYDVFARETNAERRRTNAPQSTTLPVVKVSWETARNFCDWLTARERATGKIGAHERYRLPSDHEWSCAIGIGDREDASASPSEKNGRLPEVFPWGDAWPPPHGAGNFADSSPHNRARAIPDYFDGFPASSPAMSFPPNALGIYDLSGNVWEWCEDAMSATDSRRVLRGGSWNDSAAGMLRSAARASAAPDFWLNSYGFRVVLATTSSGEAQPP